MCLKPKLRAVPIRHRVTESSVGHRLFQWDKKKISIDSQAYHTDTQRNKVNLNGMKMYRSFFNLKRLT